MKSVAILTFSLVFGILRFALADDIVRSNAGKQRATQPAAKVINSRVPTTTGVRNSTTYTGRRRLGVEPSIRNPQNFPNLVRPVDRRSLAMNVPKTLPENQPTALWNKPRRTQKFGGTINNAWRPGGNNQAAVNNRRSYFDALKRCHRERHDRNWWNRHCRTIVFVNTGYYYLDSSYWYPAYGYSQTYDSYENDGPIYTYSNLLPDQVIANVQAALRDAGYYVGPITGSLGPATRAALSYFQRDYGLIITGAIDEPTVQSLGLN